MVNIKNIGKTNEYVYDISLDGSTVNALGRNVLSNTDGFNFKLPSKFRYTEENPYIGKGFSRETKAGKAYTGFEADVAEFNDTFMCDKHYAQDAINKMGLGIDEVVSSTINFSRKNYADYFPEKPFPNDVKLVGNTIKSKKMPEYIAKFLTTGIRLLLKNKGQEFLDTYYDYVEKIYNYRIPLKDIATKGKVKKTISEYLMDCKTLTAAGRPKSRQAWMELAIREGLKVEMGETLYYINIGKTKSQADCKKVTHIYMSATDHTDITSRIDREFKKIKAEGNFPDKEAYISRTYPYSVKEEEIILNCQLLPREIVESEEDTYGDFGIEYNVVKYLDMFNKRITPLLVCFSRDIRDRILIMNPSDRPYFTEEESKLVNSQPNKEADQDTYEQLMTMADKEIFFWATHPQYKIPFLDECGMDWNQIYSDYLERKQEEEENGTAEIKQAFNDAILCMSESDYETFMEDGTLPVSLSKIVELDETRNVFVSVKNKELVIGTPLDIIEMLEPKEHDREIS